MTWLTELVIFEYLCDRLNVPLKGDLWGRHFALTPKIYCHALDGFQLPLKWRGELKTVTLSNQTWKPVRRAKPQA